MPKVSEAELILSPPKADKGSKGAKRRRVIKVKKRIKINGWIIALSFLAVVIFPNIFLRRPQEFFLDQAAKLTGIILITLGQVIRASARGFKSERSEVGYKLVIEGPYGMVRNPMYLGIILIGFGIIIAVFQWWVALVFFLIFVIRYILLILSEEKKLEAMFRESYLLYKTKVSRLFPPIKKISRTDIAVYLPLKTEWAKKEASSWCGVIFGVLFLDAWRTIRAQGWRIDFFASIAMAVVTLAILWFAAAYLIRHTQISQANASVKSKDSL